jgi:hypothetical protein
MVQSCAYRLDDYTLYTMLFPKKCASLPYCSPDKGLLVNECYECPTIESRRELFVQNKGMLAAATVS